MKACNQESNRKPVETRDVSHLSIKILNITSRWQQTSVYYLTSETKLGLHSVYVQNITGLLVITHECVAAFI